jgi:small subunit ribosomal protein S4
VELFRKGERAAKGKSALTRRGPVARGQHGSGRRRRESVHGLQLREKQRAKRYYGVRERRFRRYVAAASRRREGPVGEGSVLSEPARAEITAPVDEQPIVEFSSRR